MSEQDRLISFRVEQLPHRPLLVFIFRLLKCKPFCSASCLVRRGSISLARFRNTSVIIFLIHSCMSELSNNVDGGQSSVVVFPSVCSRKRVPVPMAMRNSKKEVWRVYSVLNSFFCVILF